MHAVRALVGCVAGDGELTKENGSVAVVGKDEKFTLIEGEELQPYLDRLELEGGNNNGGNEEEEEEEKDDDENEAKEEDAMET